MPSTRSGRSYAKRSRSRSSRRSGRSNSRTKRRRSLSRIADLRRKVARNTKNLERTLNKKYTVRQIYLPLYYDPFRNTHPIPLSGILKTDLDDVTHKARVTNTTITNYSLCRYPYSSITIPEINRRNKWVPGVLYGLCDIGVLDVEATSGTYEEPFIRSMHSCNMKFRIENPNDEDLIMRIFVVADRYKLKEEELLKKLNHYSSEELTNSVENVLDTSLDRPLTDDFWKRPKSTDDVKADDWHNGEEVDSMEILRRKINPKRWSLIKYKSILIKRQEREVGDAANKPHTHSHQSCDLRIPMKKNLKYLEGSRLPYNDSTKVFMYFVRINNDIREEFDTKCLDVSMPMANHLFPFENSTEYSKKFEQYVIEASHSDLTTSKFADQVKIRGPDSSKTNHPYLPMLIETMITMEEKLTTYDYAFFKRVPSTGDWYTESERKSGEKSTLSNELYRPESLTKDDNMTIGLFKSIGYFQKQVERINKLLGDSKKFTSDTMTTYQDSVVLLHTVGIICNNAYNVFAHVWEAGGFLSKALADVVNPKHLPYNLFEHISGSFKASEKQELQINEPRLLAKTSPSADGVDVNYWIEKDTEDQNYLDLDEEDRRKLVKVKEKHPTSTQADWHFNHPEIKKLMEFFFSQPLAAHEKIETTTSSGIKVNYPKSMFVSKTDLKQILGSNNDWVLVNFGTAIMPYQQSTIPNITGTLLDQAQQDFKLLYEKGYRYFLYLNYNVNYKWVKDIGGGGSSIPGSPFNDQPLKNKDDQIITAVVNYVKEYPNKVSVVPDFAIVADVNIKTYLTKLYNDELKDPKDSSANNWEAVKLHNEFPQNPISLSHNYPKNGSSKVTKITSWPSKNSEYTDALLKILPTFAEVNNIKANKNFLQIDKALQTLESNDTTMERRFQELQVDIDKIQKVLWNLMVVLLRNVELNPTNADINAKKQVLISRKWKSTT